jgi:hypothetical protein
VKTPALLVLGFVLGIAGCSGSSNSANTQTTSAAVEASSAAAPASPGEGAAGALPVYPGATKSAMLGTMDVNRCGHKVSVTTYTVNADVKTVTDWYAAHIPSGIRVDAGHALGAAALMSNTEIFQPDGSAAAGISQANAAALGQSAAGKPSPVYIGLGTYTPALSQDELQTMQALLGGDPAARKDAAAKMKVKCGPNSVPSRM